MTRLRSVETKRGPFARLAIVLASLAMVAAAPAPVDSARMRAANASPDDWMSVGRTWDEQRFSPLDQVNDKTVGQLGLAWWADVDTDRGVEATPLVVGGVLYNTAPWNVTTAFDAATGRVLWTYDPQVPREFGRKACCDIVSRGVAVWQGKVFVAALDGRLIALDAATGKPMWTVQTFDQSQPYTITGAARVFDGMVVIGNGGGDIGVRGYVTAYDAATGKQLWRVFTTPGDPAKGFESKALRMAARTWSGEWWKQGGGGGTAWDSIVYDPKLKLVYIGVGNGGPWVRKFRSPGAGGDNLFLSSILAVHARNGAYAWHYQETPGEEWDYTATQSMILADLKIDGRLRHVLMQAPKNGFFYVLDRATGKLISARNYVPVTWASGIDPKTGRPIENPAARYGETPVMVSPGASGAHNFNPMAFSPLTGLAYFPAVESYMGYASTPTYTPGKGNGFAFSGHPDERKQIAEYAEAHLRAWLTAWDPVRQKEVWRVEYPRNGSGGALATAGNLVFQGTINQTFDAFRADTGQKLWEFPAQNVPIAAPMTYAVGGVQYVAINAGWGGGTAHVESFRFRDLRLSKARLLVFRLGGTAQLPPMAPAAPTRQPPPPSTASAELIAKGGRLYAGTCAACHGAEARGGVKDLRQMTPETHAAFLDIVLGGARSKNGMASFADVLSRTDAEAVHAYLISRANEDWAAAGGK